MITSTPKPKTTTSCDCGGGKCGYDSLHRMRYFHGMLLTDEHLQVDQDYHRASLRRINRYLFGQGIVCGLQVEHIGGFCIKVLPGFALDCHGNPIEVCKPVTIDLTEVCKKAYPDLCDVKAPRKELERCVMIRYAEIEDDPEPVFTPADDCGCGDQSTKCQKSRIHEGWCIEVCEILKKHLPKPVTQPAATSVPNPWVGMQAPQSNATDDDCMKDTPECPVCECDCRCGCCDECWVGLATLEIHCDEGTVKIKCDCRAPIIAASSTKKISGKYLGPATGSRGTAGSHRILGGPLPKKPRR